MTAQELKDDIAWYHRAIAGIKHLCQLDDEYLQWLLMHCWLGGSCRPTWRPRGALQQTCEGCSGCHRTEYPRCSIKEKPHDEASFSRSLSCAARTTAGSNLGAAVVRTLANLVPGLK